METVDDLVDYASKQGIGHLDIHVNVSGSVDPWFYHARSDLLMDAGDKSIHIPEVQLAGARHGSHLMRLYAIRTVEMKGYEVALEHARQMIEKGLEVTINGMDVDGAYEHLGHLGSVRSSTFF